MPDENGRMDPLEAADQAMLEHAPDKYHKEGGRVVQTMTPLRFVIIDMDAPDEPLFWSNADGWVGWGTPGILEATATETEEQKVLPLGAYGSKEVQWITRMTANRLVQHLKKRKL